MAMSLAMPLLHAAGGASGGDGGGDGGGAIGDGGDGGSGGVAGKGGCCGTRQNPQARHLHRAQFSAWLLLHQGKHAS